MRILIVKLSSLGDLFHALPAVHNLKTGLDASVDWLVQTEYTELVGQFADVDRVLAFHRRAFVRTFGAFVRELRAESYDLVVDLQGLLKSAIATRLARAKRRIGPSFHREGAHLFYGEHPTRPRGERRHAVDKCLDVAEYLGASREPVRFPIDFPDPPPGLRVPRVAILPCSRWASKNWPVAQFRELARRLTARHGLDVALIGGPDDANVCADIERATGGAARSLAGRTNLIETGSLLQRVELVISNDSGPVHMAAAVGTPTLVLFGPTDPERTGPYGSGHRVLRAATNCEPCYERHCRCREAGLSCMEQLTVDRVEQNALEMLAD